MKRILIVAVAIGLVTSMALWDTDKTNSNRLNPKINAKDSVANRMAHGTTGFTLKQEDSDTMLGKLIIKDGKLILQKDENTFLDMSNGSLDIIRTDGTVVAELGQAILGDDASVKIAQPGFDATSTDNANLVITSNLNSFKIVDSGTATTPAIGSKGASSSVTITHNLGFVPLIVAFADYASGYTPLPVIAPNVSTGTIQQFIDIEFATSSSFQVWAYNTTVSSSTTMPATSIKYYLLQETAN